MTIGPGPAFEPWYESHWGRLVGALTLAVGSHATAEDVAADAFRKAFERWDDLTARGDPSAWLYTVAWNQVRSRHRRLVSESRALRRLQTRNEPMVAGPAAPSPEVWAAVRRLPPRARQAVALRYIADLTESDIATVMGVSRGTVAWTLSDARRRLSDELHEASSASPEAAEEDRCSTR